MKISQCITPFFYYQRMNLKKNTLRNYEFILGNFKNHFGDIELSAVTSEDILAFMSTIADGTK
jgi:hypothetical protein